MKPAANTLHSELVPARDAASRRLLIMLHGLGDSIAGFRWLPPALNLPWLNYLLVNAPDQYYGGYFWVAFFWGISPPLGPTPDMPFLLVVARPPNRFCPPRHSSGGCFPRCPFMPPAC